MIASLEGEISLVRPNWLILSVNNIGYKVSVGPDLLSRIHEGSHVLLFTYAQYREDSASLYGFEKIDDLDFFELLISVSGIGPKAAMGILSAASVEKIRASIVKQDPTLLSSVPGIGKKTAEKVVIELKNKVGSTASIFDSATSEKVEDVYEALLGLGFKPLEARESLANMPDDCVTTESQLKYCLSMLKR
jgi:holliday junction DNA helicase RuvA